MLDLHFKTALVDSWMDWKGQDYVVKPGVIQARKKGSVIMAEAMENIYTWREGRLMSV